MFQRTLEELFRGQQGVTIYLDDILVTGRDADEHNERLQKVLETLLKAGLCLKKSKMLDWILGSGVSGLQNQHRRYQNTI